MSLAEGACSTANEREQEALEESSRLVKSLLERVEQVDVELLGFVDIFANAVENNHFQESLNNMGLARNEDSCRLVAGISRPLVGLGDSDDVFPVRDCRENLEGLWQRSGLVSRKNLADPGIVSLCRHFRFQLGTYLV
jgi:hypothetical protein